jgi:hypothetical protein
MSADNDRPRKRQRISQACQRCRARKFRCDGGSPSCGACTSAQATCSYDTTSARPRGLKPGYVKILESLWGSVFQNIPGSERVASHLLTSLPANAENAVDEAGNDDASPLKTWRASSIPENIRALLDGRPLRVYDSPGLSNTTWSLPPTSGSANIERHEVHAPSLPSTSTFVPAPSYSLDPGDSYLPELPQDWQNLVQVYLCTEYSCLPIFEKSCPYRWAYKYQDHSSTDMFDLESLYCGQYASLWAILVLGELHLHGAKSIRMSQLKRTAKTFLATAESRGPDSTYSYAFLIWALVYTGSQSFTLARMMLAQATILADTPKDGTSALANGCDTLVQNGCFVMETVLAVATGSQASPITVDADAFHSGDVGEWDPFINILHQGQGFATSGASSQVPPSRTGSTFTALVKLMTILRQTSQPGRHPEASAADLRLWEVSLAADLRGAMTAQGRAPHPPVPSQLNLQSWYSILCCTIASLRQGLTGSNNTEAPGNPTMQVVDALHTIEQAHGLGMLPATSSILLLQASHLPAALFSHQDNASAAHNQLIAAFSDRWDWSGVYCGVQSGFAAIAIPDTQATIDQAVVHPPSTVEATSVTTVLGQQETGFDHSQYSAAATGTVLPPGLLEIEYANETDQLSQQQAVNQIPTATDDTSAATDIDSGLQRPASYDLLEYLTMFENNNGYVDKIRSPSSMGLQFQLLIPNTARTEAIWHLSDSLGTWTTLHERVVLQLVGHTHIITLRSTSNKPQARVVCLSIFFLIGLRVISPRLALRSGDTRPITQKRLKNQSRYV